MNNKKEKHALLKRRDSWRRGITDGLFSHRVISFCGECAQHSRISRHSYFPIWDQNFGDCIFFFFAMRVKMMKLSDEKERR